MVSVIIREAQEEGLHPVCVRGGEYVRRGRGLALPLICGELGGRRDRKQNIERRQRNCESAEVKKEIKTEYVGGGSPFVTHTRRLRWPRRGWN